MFCPAPSVVKLIKKVVHLNSKGGGGRPEGGTSAFYKSEFQNTMYSGGKSMTIFSPFRAIFRSAPGNSGETQ